MKAFFKKYKWTICYWVILAFLIFYFAPRQREYYLDPDIKQFENHVLYPALYWIFGLVSAGLLVYWLVTLKSVMQSARGFVSVIVASIFFIFMSERIMLGFALFANRQINRGKVTRTYQASFMAGPAPSKESFDPYDPTTKQIVIDTKLKNELYHVGLKQNDSITLTMNKGLFGLAFNVHPLDDDYRH